MPILFSAFADLIGKVEVVWVKPSGTVRQSMGAQKVQVALKHEGSRYTAVFFKTEINGKEVIKTEATFRNGLMFGEDSQRIRIPEIPFAALARRAAAILKEKPANLSPAEMRG